MFKPVLFLGLLLMSGLRLVAQQGNFFKRYINSLINDTTNSADPQFIAYPTLAFAPETSWELGISSLLVYYAKKDTANRLSEVNGFTFYTINKQYGVWFDHALYSHQNKYAYLGRLRYQNFPILYYGIGPETVAEPMATVNAQLIQVRERVLRKVARNLYLGPEIDLQRLSSVSFDRHNGYGSYVAPEGNQGSISMGIGAGLVYDDRHNVLNVRNGAFAELALLKYAPALGSSTSFTSVISDNRFYYPVSKRNVFAAQVYGQFVSGQPPFNMLSSLGGETIMRGYYAGRYRDKNQLSMQAEFRMLPLPWRFTKRFGATFFAGTGTVFNSFGSLQVNQFVWAGGVGMRYLLFPKKDIFTRLDFAFTKEGTGFYIFIGEAF